LDWQQAGAEVIAEKTMGKNVSLQMGIIIMLQGRGWKVSYGQNSRG
jgi:hypothetical protein